MSDQTAASPPAAPTSTSFSLSDALSKEHADALAAVKAEGEAAQAPPTPSADQPTVQGADTVPAATPTPQPSPPSAVPYPRFAEVYGEARRANTALSEAEKRIANLEGQLAQVAKTPPAPSAPPPPNPIQVIDHRRRQIGAEILNLDRAFAKGDLTVQEHLEKTRALQSEKENLTDRRSEIVSGSLAERALSRVPQPAPAPTPTPPVRGSLAVKQAVMQIEAAESWVRNVPQDFLMTPTIQRRVEEMARSIESTSGKPLPIDRSEEGIVNRTALTVLVAKEMGLDRAYGSSTPEPVPGQAPATAPPPPMKQPPAIGAMGVGAPAPIPGSYTEEQIARMDLDDVMKLPAEVRNHFIGARA